MAFKLGNASLLARRRRISSKKSKDISFSLFVAVPPDRQLSPLHGQLTLFTASMSIHSRPLFDANRGEITTVSSRAPARNVAASAVRSNCPHRVLRRAPQPALV